MNERIKELLNRSGGEFYEGFLGSPNTIKFTEEELKTFADLIVKESADDAKYHVMNISTYADADFVYEQIKRNFGVEE
jgi:hypothetical protein